MLLDKEPLLSVPQGQMTNSLDEGRTPAHVCRGVSEAFEPWLLERKSIMQSLCLESLSSVRQKSCQIYLTLACCLIMLGVIAFNSSGAYASVTSTAAYVHVFVSSKSHSVFFTSKVPGARVTNTQCFAVDPGTWNFLGYITNAGDAVTLTDYQGGLNPLNRHQCLGYPDGSTIHTTLPNPLINTQHCWFNVPANKLSGCNGG